MKKNNILLIFLFLIIISCISCKKNELKIYHHDEINNYIDELYQTINDLSLKYACFDLRDKDIYEEGHLRQFQNINQEQLINYILDNYRNNYYIYIFSEIDLKDEILKELAQYKEVHILIDNYDELRTLGDEYFIFDTGPYDCMC